MTMMIVIVILLLINNNNLDDNSVFISLSVPQAHNLWKMCESG